MANDYKTDVVVDVDALREEVKNKYREVAADPHGKHHFHTGRYLAKHLGYDDDFVGSLPDVAVECLRASQVHLRFAHSQKVNASSTSDRRGLRFVRRRPSGGPDRTSRRRGHDRGDARKSRSTVGALGLTNVEFREGLAEDLPVEDAWADVVISNGVINLCADKKSTFSEIYRVLRPGGRLQFADIANGKPVPASAMQNVDLWTA